MFKWF